MDIFSVITLLGGLAFFLYGMNVMSNGLEKMAGSKLEKILRKMTSNRFKGLALGAGVTAIIQSSSASVGILQALSISCFLPYSTAIPVILGQNIGTTVTPIISSISGNVESKRVAMCCLYIKMIGVVVVVGVFYLLDWMFNFAFMDAQSGALGIAFVHTLFNIVSTVILIPFCSLIEKLAIKTVKGKKEEEDEEADVFAALDDRFLKMPSFAVAKCRGLVCEMAVISAVSLEKATTLMNNFDPELFKEVEALESKIDKYEDKTSSYLLKIASHQMSSKDSKVVTELLHCIGDIERISDHALNIAETAQEIYTKKISFSEQATKDIAVISAAVEEILDLAVKALAEEDLASAFRVEPLEQVIDRLKRKIKNGHISRLRQGDCTMELGFILSDLLTNYERISDHCSNIAVCFIEIAHDTFETHEYLNQLKSDEQTEFTELYEAYKKKYYIA